MALGVQINVQQPTQLHRAVRSLERPVLPPGHAPGQHRLAELFLKNTPEKNNADPRLAPDQAIVDAAIKAAHDRGGNARMVGSVGEATRQLVAERIKKGGTLDPDLALPADAIKGPASPSRDRSR